MTLSCRSECCTQIHVPVKRAGRHEHPQLQRSPTLRSDHSQASMWQIYRPAGVSMVPEPYEACQRSARSNDSTINNCGPLTCSGLHWEMMKRTHTHKHNVSPSVYARGISLMVGSFAFYQTKSLQLWPTVSSVT